MKKIYQVTICNRTTADEWITATTESKTEAETAENGYNVIATYEVRS